MHQDVESIMFTKEQLAARIGELAAQLDKEYAGKTPLMVGILKGAKSSGEVKLIKDLDRKIEGKDVIIVEDIIDSGYTLSYLKRNLYARKPESVKICALLDKYSRRVVPIEADYKGFDCADEFVVGFGLDYAERYRNLPYIGVLKRSVYEK